MYDEKEITKEIIRSENVADLKLHYGLDYILPKRAVIGDVNVKKHTDAAVFMHLFYDDYVEKVFSYISKIVSVCDIYITTSKKEIKHYLENQFLLLNIKNCRIKLVENRGYDIASLLVHHKDDILQYKYFCFTHDKKSTHIKDIEISKLWFNSLWENTVSTPSFICNVLQCFEKNRLLGVLSVPLPFLPEWFSDKNNYWYNSYYDTEELAKNLGLSCKLSIDKMCISVGTAFWARTEAVRLLFEKGYSLSDFPDIGVSSMSYAIERIFPYIAQHEGFYTGTVLSDEYEVFRSNYMYSHIRTLYSYYRKLLPFNDHIDFTTWNGFIQTYQTARYRYSSFYIYGAGKEAEKFIKTVLCESRENDGIKFDAIVVSDGYRSSSTFMGLPVLEFSEIQNKENCFFIIALSDKYAKNVLELLESHKIFYYQI